VKRLLVAFALLLAFVACGAVAYRFVFAAKGPGSTWIVSSYSGQVQVRVGGGEWADVGMKTPLSDGDRIRTGPDGEATLLKDDSQVTVRSASEIAISQLNDEASRFQVAVGHVFVEARGEAVSLRSDSGARVDARDAGLAMTVRTDGWTQVKVKRGDAEFTAEGKTEKLQEGQESHAEVGKPPSTPVAIPESILQNVKFPDADTFTVQLARVEGTADPGARVKVGGQMVDVALDGTWSADVKLDEGINQIDVEATDALGTTQSVRSQPLRVDTTAPGLSGAAIGGKSVSGGLGGPFK
jgi:hypothetical protein